MRARPMLGALALLLIAPAMPAPGGAAPELRDPMQPPALALRKMREAKQASAARRLPAQARTAPAKPFRLTSILVGPERSVAIIDDQTLALGDSIRGARLVRLTRNSARLLQRGRIINLELDGGAGATISKKAVQENP